MSDGEVNMYPVRNISGQTSRSTSFGRRLKTKHERDHRLIDGFGLTHEETSRPYGYSPRHLSAVEDQLPPHP
jgi:hypothetical protein